MLEVYNKAKELLESAYNNNDEDARAVIDGGYEEAFCQLFDDCYNWDSFCAWLVEHDLDIAQDFRYADIKSFDEIIEEVDRGEEDPDGTYNLDVDEWENLSREEKIERIKDSADCLMIGEEGLCISW